MDTTNNSETPQRRVDDRAPAATINWEAPGAPAVPVRQAQPAAPGFITNEQIAAGAAVECDHGQPIGRNVAIDVFDAMNNVSSTAGPALPADLQQLKALALAADQGEGQHIYTNPRDSNGWKANEAWHRAAAPAVVLDLIARIERATAPHAAEWNLTDARESLTRAQAFPGFNALPQPLRVEIDNAASILAKLDAAPHGSAAPTEAAPDDLHDAIMNIRIDDANENIEYTGTRSAYRHGHRDARHAAAELAATQHAAPVALQAAPVGGEPLTLDGLMRVVRENWGDQSAIEAAFRADLTRRAAVAAAKAPTGEMLLPTMRSAFRVEESGGDLRRYAMRFNFQSLEDLDKAGDEWRAFVAAPVEQGQGAAPSENKLLAVAYDRFSKAVERGMQRSSPAPVGAGVVPERASFQQRVQPWMMECFGPIIAADHVERNHRFLEEALELVQACGCTASEAHQLVDYVFGRPVGDIKQEIGGVMVTLAALCLAQRYDMHDAGEVELARIWTKVEQIRAKQAAKPKNSPLPATPTAATAHPVAEDDQVRDKIDAERYRYLRNPDPQPHRPLDVMDDNYNIIEGKKLDAAIDALKSRTTAHGGAQGEAK